MTFLPVDGSTSATKSASDAPASGASASASAKPASDSSSSDPRSIGVDVITDTAYSGALKLGVAHIFGLYNHSYLATQHAGSNASQITEVVATPTEITLGYSVYMDALLHDGRTYDIAYGTGFTRFLDAIEKHTGVFAALGVLGYENAKLDYLRTLYFGVEGDLGRRISVAATLAIHRDNELVAASVGGPVPATGIQTSSSYGVGFGLVFNVTGEFFEFVERNPGMLK